MSQIGDPVRVVEIPDPIHANPVQPDSPSVPVPDFVPETWPSSIPADPVPAGAP